MKLWIPSRVSREGTSLATNNQNHKQTAEGGVATVVIRANKLLCILLIVTVLLSQSACWDKVEVEELAIVLAIALDKGEGEDGNIRVTVQTVNPKGISGGAGAMGGGGGNGPAAYRNFSNQGKTIFDAVRSMTSAVPRQLYFSHNQVIIISEELAREGVVDLMDFFDRNPQIRRNNWVLISTKETDLYKLLDSVNPLEIAPAGRIVSIIQETDREPVYAPSQLGDFLEMLAEGGISAYTGGLGFVINEAVTANNADATSGGQVNNAEINLSSTAVFIRGRMVGWLNERETKGLLWVREGLNGGIYTVHVEGQEKEVSLEVINSSSDMKPTVTEEGDIIFTIDIKTQANVVESRAYVDYSKPESLVKIKQLLQDKIKQDIEMALIIAQQQHRTDVFGFGGAIYRQYPEYWKQIADQWQEIIYPNVEVMINVKAEIPRTGLVSQPLQTDVE